MPNVPEDVCKLRTDNINEKLDVIIANQETFRTVQESHTLEIALIKSKYSGTVEVIKHGVTAIIPLVLGFVGIKLKQG